MEGENRRALRALVACVCLGFAAPLAAKPAPSAEQALEQYGQLPIAFEANRGQLDTAVRFAARGAGYSLQLRADGSELHLYHRDPGSSRLQSSVLRTRLLGADTGARVDGEAPLPGRSHYLSGDAAQWRTEVPHYGAVRYHAVYPGVDLVYHGSQQQMEYDFVVAPGADPSRIALSFEGAAAAPRVDADGHLVIATAGGDLIQQRPVVYQEIDGRRVAVEGSYRLQQDRVGFALGRYDATRPLVIDPLLGYKLYVPGINVLQARALAVLPDGSALIAGYSPLLPLLRNLPLVDTAISYEAFVAKLNPAGNTLLWTSFIGGSDDEEITDIAADAAGEAVLVGYTRSNEFPLKNPVQGSKGGYSDAFVAKLGANGKTLAFSTYLGGNSQDTADAVALDPAGNIYVAGTTDSANFPVHNALRPVRASSEGFVAKLDAGGALIYSTFIGGSSYDNAADIAADAAGNAYVTGSTTSKDFPVVNAFQSAISVPPPVPPATTPPSPNEDVYVAKISPQGDALLYSTYLGGYAYERSRGLRVDGSGQAYVVGETGSTNFPLQAPLQAGFARQFVSKLGAAGDTLVYSTYLGSPNGFDVPADLTVDALGAAYITGYTRALDYPVRFALQGYNAGGQDIFLSKLAPAGDALEYSTYFGAPGEDGTTALALGSDGSVYLAGNTTSRNFPVKNPVQGASWGAGDAIAMKFTANAQAVAYSTYLGETNIYLNSSISGDSGLSPEDPALSIAVPLRGLIGCTLRVLPTDVIGDLSLLWRSRIPCGELPPPP